MKAIYFARAMEGLSRSDILLHYAEVDKVLSQIGLRLINPFQEKNFLVGQGCEAEIDKEAYRIVRDDLERLRQADILLVDLSIPKHSYIGCVCEIVYAYLLEKPVVVYVGDSDNGSRLWLHYHATYICATLEEAIDYIKKIS